MILRPHPAFKKSYQKRIARNKKLAQKTRERIALFAENPYHPLLGNHALTGAKKTLRAISVTGDYRIVYLPLSENEAMLMDIGTHNQVY